MQQPSGETSVPLEQHRKASKHQAEIKRPKHNLILPKVKWIISTNPGQTVDWLCYFDIFLKKNNCPVHIQKEKDTTYFWHSPGRVCSITPKPEVQLKFLILGQMFFVKLKKGEDPNLHCLQCQES